MSILILISSAVLCLIISLILDLTKFSDKEDIKDYDTSYNEGLNIAIDSLKGKIDNLNIKINDIFKVLKSDSIKNAIAETNTYIKATINEVASIKKSVEKISNFENQIKETNLSNLDDKFFSLENKIDEIRKEFIDKFNLLISTKSTIIETPEPAEDSLSINNDNKDEIGEDKSATLEEKVEEEIDRDFNPDEIDLETTPIETIVENQKIDEEQNVIDSFLDENNNNKQDIEEEEEKEKEEESIEEDSEETTIKNNKEEENYEEESIVDENIEEEEEEEDEDKKDETENKTEENETKTSEEDLATKIKKLKERLNSPTKDE